MSQDVTHCPTDIVCGLIVTIDLARYVDTHGQSRPRWWQPLGTSAMALSLGVNALVSTLMISRIRYVYVQTKSSGEHSVNRLSWLISVLVESAVALFVAQLIYLVLYALKHDAFLLVAGVQVGCTIVLLIPFSFGFVMLTDSHH